MAGLITIAKELLITILENLCTQELLHIEKVCKKIRNVARVAYRASYGTQICHRDVDHPPDFRRLAIEQLKYDLGSDQPRHQWTPEGAMESFLDVEYLATKSELRNLATYVLLCAGTGRDSPEWNEAVVTAMMAQARFTEAEAQYRKLIKITALPERTFLTAARFGWPFAFRHPDPTSQNLSELAFLGATAAGNKDMLGTLNRNGVRWDICLRSENAAVIAAKTGQVDMLEYLWKQGLDILAPPPLQDKPMVLHAIEFGEVEAAAYLLQAGAPLIDDHLWHVSRGRNTNIIRYFLSQRPNFVKACSPSGALAVEHFFQDNVSLEECKTLLRLFIEAGSFNIEDRGYDGRSPIHLAAEAGRSDLCQLVISLGADMKALDSAGMSVFEIASNGHHNELLRWLEGHTAVDIDRFTVQKSMHAKRLVNGMRGLWLEILVRSDYMDHFIADKLDEKKKSVETRWIAAEMDKKLTICWAKAHSAVALEEYTGSIIGSRTEILLHRLILVISLACLDGAITPELNEVQRAHIPQACIVVGAFTVLTDPSPLQETFAKHVTHNFTIDEIRDILRYLQSSLGVMMQAGSKRKRTEELKIFTCFET